MKPVAVDVLAPNVGVNAPLTPDIAVTGAEPFAVFALVVLIVTVELVPVATPVTVTNPVSLIATKPDDVVLPAHVPDHV